MYEQKPTYKLSPGLKVHIKTYKTTYKVSTFFVRLSSNLIVFGSFRINGDEVMVFLTK